MSTTTSCLQYFDTSQVCTDPDRTDNEKYCSGCDSSVYEGNNWEDHKCKATFSNILFSQGTGIYDSNNIFRLQEDVNHLYEQWLALGNTLTEPNAAGYSTFQSKLLNLCTDSTSTPGVCDNFLCNQVCPSVEYSDLSTFLGSWCGCYTPPPEAQRSIYEQNIPSTAVEPNSDRGLAPCYPTCHQLDTVQLYDLSTGEPYTCSNNVCVLDQVVVDSDDPVNVNLTTICSQCLGGDSACSCIVSSDQEDLINTVGGQLEFNTICGANSVCYIINDDQTTTAVNCDELVNSPEAITGGSVALWILIVILIAVAIISIIWMIVSMYKMPKQKNMKVQAQNSHIQSNYENAVLT